MCDGLMEVKFLDVCVYMCVCVLCNCVLSGERSPERSSCYSPALPTRMSTSLTLSLSLTQAYALARPTQITRPLSLTHTFALIVSTQVITSLSLSLSLSLSHTHTHLPYPHTLPHAADCRILEASADLRVEMSTIGFRRSDGDGPGHARNSLQVSLYIPMLCMYIPSPRPTLPFITLYACAYVCICASALACAFYLTRAHVNSNRISVWISPSYPCLWQVDDTVGPWECKNLVFMGCMCERGRATAVVVKVSGRGGGYVGVGVWRDYLVGSPVIWVCAHSYTCAYTYTYINTYWCMHICIYVHIRDTKN
jgi:hypothetical protein